MLMTCMFIYKFHLLILQLYLLMYWVCFITFIVPSQKMLIILIATLPPVIYQIKPYGPFINGTTCGTYTGGDTITIIGRNLEMNYLSYFQFGDYHLSFIAQNISIIIVTLPLSTPQASLLSV